MRTPGLAQRLLGPVCAKRNGIVSVPLIPLRIISATTFRFARAKSKHGGTEKHIIVRLKI